MFDMNILLLAFLSLCHIFTINTLFLNKTIMDTQETRDAHGNILIDGDHVFLIKDLTIKGSKNTIKQ